MKIESEFKKSIILSALLHLSIMLVFNISLIPGRGVLKNKSEVFFYGPRLTNWASLEDIKTGPGAISHLDKKLQTFFPESLSFFSDTNDRKETFYVNPVRNSISNGVKLEKPDIELVESRKLLAYFSAEGLDFIDSAKTKDKEESQLDLRNLVFSKVPPSEMVYLEDEDNFNFKLRVFISSEGKVEFIEPLFFSGKPELDLLVKKLIKEWSFLPYQNSSGWQQINFDPKLVSAATNLK